MNENSRLRQIVKNFSMDDVNAMQMHIYIYMYVCRYAFLQIDSLEIC